MPFQRTALVAFACSLVLVGSSCSSDSKAAPSTASSGPAVEAGAAFPTERCNQNKSAGTITYLSGFDFAASASIVDVLVAEQKGYFAEMCLDVDVVASDSTLNYPQIGNGTAQFASGGSFSEVVRYRDDHEDADLVTLAVEGRSAIDVLLVHPDIVSLSQIEGTQIGVKESLTPSIQAMLAAAGLEQGTDYRTTPMDGYDPVAHIQLPGIVGFPGYRSNEPGQLDRAGIAYNSFAPADMDIPGSFGVIYTNRQFMVDHPTATVDFMRAAMQGLADAVADPAAASMIALDFIDNNGNPQGLSTDGESFRWQTEAKLVAEAMTAGDPLATPDGELLDAEVSAYAAIGLFGGDTPDIDDAYDATVLDAIYDDGGQVIWPTT